MAASVEEDDWARHPFYMQKQMTEVHTIARLLGISEVDTVNQTVMMKMSLNLYWTDERLVVRDRQTPGAKMPDNLWGPWPELANAIAEGFTIELLAKGFHDRESGQMNQIVVWEGRLNNPMNLKDFPFDCDFIDLIFVNERACLGTPGDDLKFVGQMNTYKLVELTRDSPRAKEVS